MATMLDLWGDRDGTALVAGDTEITWSELQSQVLRLASVLTERSSPGALVAVAGANTPETLVSHVACLVTGRAAVGVNPRQTADEIAYLLEDSGAEILLGAANAAGGSAAEGQIVAPAGVLLWGEGVPAPNSWHAALASAPEATLDQGLEPAVPLLYTSGTSGRPKGTRVRWLAEPGATVADFVHRLVDSVGHLPEGPHIVAGPLYHNGPLLAVRALLGGHSVVLPPKFDAEQFLALIEARRVTSSLVVPTHLNRLLALEEDTRDRYDVSSLGKVLLTGAACPSRTKRAIIDWWGPVVDEAYGGTESGTVCMITSPEWLAHPGSVGRVTSNFEVVVIGEGGDRLGPDETGQLYFRDRTGRGVVYHNAPDKTAHAHREPGVFTLGDVGHVDAEGYVHITDRDIDMVISGGVNIYPAEVERVLSECPDVRDVTVIGVPHPDMGEELLALVALRKASTSGQDVLEAWCRGRLAGYKCPRRYEFVDVLPRDGMGKINKKRLRQDHLSAHEIIGG